MIVSKNWDVFDYVYFYLFRRLAIVERCGCSLRLLHSMANRSEDSQNRKEEVGRLFCKNAGQQRMDLTNVGQGRLTAVSNRVLD